MMTCSDRVEAMKVMDDPEWEAAWVKECERRLEAYRRGEIEAVDAEVMHARISEKYGLKSGQHKP